MRIVHRLAALVAIASVGSFWISTVLVELFGTAGQIASVKQLIVYGMGLLVPAIALTGITGARLSVGRDAPGISAKRRRMPVIAANGLLVLVPLALYLNHLAAEGAFDTTFYGLQALELMAGATNLVLMVGNVALGRRMAANIA
ncbi:MAG: hypothetical protein WCZ20_10960 [Hydrogenophaga sp.]|nr:hypothetical protein [Gammaproteobacteria bacterium]